MINTQILKTIETLHEHIAQIDLRKQTPQSRHARAEYLDRLCFSAEQAIVKGEFDLTKQKSPPEHMNDLAFFGHLRIQLYRELAVLVETEKVLNSGLAQGDEKTALCRKQIQKLEDLVHKINVQFKLKTMVTEIMGLFARHTREESDPSSPLRREITDPLDATNSSVPMSTEAALREIEHYHHTIGMLDLQKAMIRTQSPEAQVIKMGTEIEIDQSRIQCLEKLLVVADREINTHSSLSTEDYSTLRSQLCREHIVIQLVLDIRTREEWALNRMLAKLDQTIAAEQQATTPDEKKLTMLQARKDAGHTKLKRIRQNKNKDEEQMTELGELVSQLDVQFVSLKNSTVAIPATFFTQATPTSSPGQSSAPENDEDDAKKLL
ncbi:MAG: hypothetical protein NTW08_03160 [Gammaproteobacteria bacterium]|nr:hypothetical protein [Gammaproteobacteria bacterium]